MQSNFSVITMIMQGWYATYPLLLISVICVTIIIERIWSLWGVSGRATRKADALIVPLRAGNFNEALKQVESPRNPGERVFRDLIVEASSSERERLQDVDEERRFAIVGEDEADPAIGKISWVSPLAKALTGAVVGDSVVWKRPAGDKALEVTGIAY